MDKPAAFAASAGARANATGLSSFLQAFPGDHIVDTKIEKLFPRPFGILRNDTLESYLLKNWSSGHPAYDAVYINSLSDSSQVGLSLSCFFLPCLSLSCILFPCISLWSICFLCLSILFICRTCTCCVLRTEFRLFRGWSGRPSACSAVFIITNCVCA